MVRNVFGQFIVYAALKFPIMFSDVKCAAYSNYRNTTTKIFSDTVITTVLLRPSTFIVEIYL